MASLFPATTGRSNPKWCHYPIPSSSEPRLPRTQSSKRSSWTIAPHYHQKVSERINTFLVRAASASTVVPTSKANLAKIEALVAALTKTMINLASRWSAEQQHEDIADYKAVIVKILPKGIHLVKMTKRPFGFHFGLGTDATYSMFCTTRHIGWKRVG